jgi:peptidoglycan/xylan/chitin deacetylase (PgdA/CDA1 family)
MISKIRATVRNMLISAIGACRKISPGVHILNSHYISRSDCPPDLLYSLLNGIKKHADFINIQEAVGLIEERRDVKQKLVAFTFDDGFEECYSKIAPVLKQFNTNAALFVNPGFIDGDDRYQANFLDSVVHVEGKRAVTWDMLRELHNDGFKVGNHTLDHIRLVNLDKVELERQVNESKVRIENEIGSVCDYFAWTYGGMGDIDSEVLESHKYVFSSANYQNYHSLNGSVINRRHVEGDWPVSHVNFFLSKGKSY